MKSNETPERYFNYAKALHQKRMEEEAYARANPPPPTAKEEFIAALPERGSGTPSANDTYNKVTKRCFNTGTTESGLTVQTCFTN